jgi:hypothetical protein
MNKPFHAALSALALAIAAGSAHAGVVDGNFGSLAGWTASGDAAAIDGHLVVTTSSATYQDDADAGLPTGARNVSGADPLATGGGAGSLEAALGLAGAPFDDTSHFAYSYEGSAASQSFQAAAGSTLSFSWNLGTLDQRDPTQADFAFVVIDGQVIKLADAFAASTSAAGGGDAAQTGWMDWSGTLGAGTTHTISFGVVDMGDFNDTTALSVSGVNVSAVPEASTMALMSAGLLLLALRRRARRD